MTIVFAARAGSIFAVGLGLTALEWKWLRPRLGGRPGRLIAQVLRTVPMILGAFWLNRASHWPREDWRGAGVAIGLVVGAGLLADLVLFRRELEPGPAPLRPSPPA